MPSKKKKYNARFPAGRIKKIMQTDEEVGKVAQAVPVIISRTLELFVESLLTKTLRITNARNARTLSPSHMKQCIMSENRFDFLRELVKNIPDINVSEEMLDCASPEPHGDSSPISAPSSPSPGCSRLTTIHENGITNNSTDVLQNPIGTTTISPNAKQNMDFILKTRLNFYKEQDVALPQVSSVIQHTSNQSNSKYNNNENNNEFSRPPKLARFDSAPCNLSLNSNNYKIDLTPKINTPIISLNNINSNPIFNIDLSKTNFPKSSTISSSIITPGNIGKTPRNSNVPDLKPIVKIDLSNSFSIPSTSKEIPSPPIIKNDVCNTPVVKIDYSTITLTPSPLSSPTDTCISLPSSSSSTYIVSQKPQPSTLNIDLTNIHSTGNFLNTKNMLPTASNSLEMDEDYDNI